MPTRARAMRGVSFLSHNSSIDRSMCPHQRPMRGLSFLSHNSSIDVSTAPSVQCVG